MSITSLGLGDLVKEKEDWIKSPRTRMIESGRLIEGKVIDTKPTPLLGSVNGEMKGTDIDACFSHLGENNSWSDHIVWLNPPFIGVVIEVVKYHKQNRVKYYKLLMEDNTQVWVHSNDITEP